MSALHLFDPGPGVARPDPGEKLSPTRRLTLRNESALASGVHPATRERLWTLTEGETCGSCGHCLRFDYHRRSYFKCTEHRLGITHSSASDIRASWPACLLFVGATPGYEWDDASRETEGALAALDAEIAAAAHRIASAS